ncbi:ParB/RepB/Spo0J family partition protein [Streptomyces chromofuscus]|uniref:ParB N-terminal domain-containing protein n=1 Tax=Streptomyces chromofuscus TaxID=42881 RepID=A0A7M2TAZ4_STRCW|nr:ParB/RepB/Spo0J family partition protein [Streptomyces chromofuscus]QOV44521.1 ParB N-terminal domain-containing protein [Streptomyces chromofuscus]
MERETADHLIRLRDRGIRELPVERVATHDITVDFSPRVDGEDAEYVRTLLEAEGELPPILVHRPTMTVVDGIHRLRAATAQGQTHIPVRFFDGPLTEARLLAVATNVTHGRPLTTADRAAAATYIFTAHPRWSNRAVAALTGLSAGKVAQLRKGTAADGAEHRIGRDGRARPVDSSHSRERAGELLRANPRASLRQIAAEAGLAPATVADVRNRIQRGEDPVPGRAPRSTNASPPPTTSTDRPPVQLATRRQPASTAPPPPDRLLHILDSLRRDPSLRLSESGRHILRMLSACTMVAQDREQIAAALPAHCKQPMAQLAQGYARLWTQLAHELAAGDDSAAMGI